MSLLSLDAMCSGVCPHSVRRLTSTPMLARSAIAALSPRAVAVINAVTSYASRVAWEAADGRIMARRWAPAVRCLVRTAAMTLGSQHVRDPPRPS